MASEERLEILRMLRDQKLTADEAERLLRALEEGNAAAQEPRWDDGADAPPDDDTGRRPQGCAEEPAPEDDVRSSSEPEVLSFANVAGKGSSKTHGASLRRSRLWNVRPAGHPPRQARDRSGLKRRRRSRG